MTNVEEKSQQRVWDDRSKKGQNHIHKIKSEIVWKKIESITSFIETFFTNRLETHVSSRIETSLRFNHSQKHGRTNYASYVIKATLKEVIMMIR